MQYISQFDLQVNDTIVAGQIVDVCSRQRQIIPLTTETYTSRSYLR